jgi:hypothetical protein
VSRPSATGDRAAMALTGANHRAPSRTRTDTGRILRTASMSFCDQQKQVTEVFHITCRTPHSGVASTVAVRLEIVPSRVHAAYTKVLATEVLGMTRPTACRTTANPPPTTKMADGRFHAG